MKNVLTQSVFISRCINTWGSRYDLSSAKYIKGTEKVTVICRDHGEFMVTPKNFIKLKSGCPSCGGQFGKTTQKFISEATSTHGSRYDYSKSIYQRYNIPLIIICNVHGEFRQEPSVHIRGCGCPACGKVQKVTTESFIKRAIDIHGEKYDYSKTIYTKATNKVIITCPIHGDMKQLPHNHLANRGCTLCKNESISISKTYTLDQAIKACKVKNISIVKYAGNARDDSELTCFRGHKWHAPISRINAGSGCPACATKGYNPNKSGYVYFLRSECGSYMKVGLSNNVFGRMRKMKESVPFKFSLINKVKFPGKDAPKIENKIHKMCVHSGLFGFDGSTEWFIYDQSIIDAYAATVNF